MQLVKRDFETIKQSRMLIFFTIFLLFVPKFNLISLGTYEGAGVRVDDIVLLLIAPLFLYVVCIKGTLSQIEVYFYLFFLYTLVVHVLNLPYSRGNILYPLRMLEYWMFFYLGRLYVEDKLFIKIMYMFVIYSGFLIIAQDFNLIGGYKDGLYHEVLSKPTGSTNGSYEIAMVLALICPLFFLVKNKWVVYFYVSFIALLILLTESRSALAILGCSLLFWIMFLNKTSLTSKIVLLLIMSITLFVVALSNIDSFGRFSVLFTSDTYYALEQIFYISPSQAQGDGASEFLDQQVMLRTGAVNSSLTDNISGSGDLSSMIRFNKWLWAINSYLAQGSFYVIFGIGGGVLGNALDGGLLRILVEYGVVGFTLFILFLSKISKKLLSLESLFVIIFLLGNIFIDYYLSYKVTSFFFLILGFLYSQKKLNVPKYS